MEKGDEITSLASSLSLPFTGVYIPLIRCKLEFSHCSELFPSVQYQEQHLEPKKKGEKWAADNSIWSNSCTISLEQGGSKVIGDPFGWLL